MMKKMTMLEGLTMREAIKQLLVAHVPTVNGHVWEPTAAGPQLEMPYLVLRAGKQENDEYEAHAAFYEVWPYVRRRTFQEVDQISKEVIAALHQKSFAYEGVPYYIEYVDTVSDDMVDEDWDVLTRGLRFQIFSLAWLLHTPIEPDPVEAMKRWTTARFPHIHTDPLALPTTDHPSLFWRQTMITSVEEMHWGAWLTAKMHGHLLVRDASTRRQWVEKIARQLALDTGTSLSDKSKLTFLTVSANHDQDPFKAGQIELEVRYGILHGKAVHEKLNRLEVDPKRGGVIYGKK